MKFKLTSKFRPAGDQAQSIEKLTKNIKAGAKHQVLLGVKLQPYSIKTGVFYFQPQPEATIPASNQFRS